MEKLSDNVRHRIGTAMTERNLSSEAAGLCSHCRHSQVIESSKGSVFWLCELSKTDLRFPKYPRLPVLSCAGYERRSDDQQPSKPSEPIN
jgi:hypothetical protein